MNPFSPVLDAIFVILVGVAALHFWRARSIPPAKEKDISPTAGESQPPPDRNVPWPKDWEVRRSSESVRFSQRPGWQGALFSLAIGLGILGFLIAIHYNDFQPGRRMPTTDRTIWIMMLFPIAHRPFDFSSYFKVALNLLPFLFTAGAVWALGNETIYTFRKNFCEKQTRFFDWTWRHEYRNARILIKALAEDPEKVPESVWHWRLMIGEGKKSDLLFLSGPSRETKLQDAERMGAELARITGWPVKEEIHHRTQSRD